MAVVDALVVVFVDSSEFFKKGLDVLVLIDIKVIESPFKLLFSAASCFVTIGLLEFLLQA
jgi:hypothetical protein